MTVESARSPEARSYQQVSLVDLLDRLLGTGVVLTGDIVVSLCDVDLVEIRLNALITSVRAEMTARAGR
jgi:hypothetical protein